MGFANVVVGGFATTVPEDEFATVIAIGFCKCCRWLAWVFATLVPKSEFTTVIANGLYKCCRPLAWVFVTIAPKT